MTSPAQGEHRPAVGSLGRLVVALLAVNAVVDVWAVVSQWHRAAVVTDYQHGDSSLSAIDFADTNVRSSAVAELLLFVAIAAAFITWLYRLVTRVDGVHPGVYRHSPGWAVGGWFVPFLNLVRPKQFVDDTYRATAPAGGAGGPVPWWVHAWWATFLISNVLSSTSARMASSTASGLARADRVGAVGDALDIVAACLAIATVLTLERRAAALPAPAVYVANFVFNPPPGWPAPPPTWTPPPGWRPDPSWPEPPADWQYWLPRHT